MLEGGSASAEGAPEAALAWSAGMTSRRASAARPGGRAALKCPVGAGRRSAVLAALSALAGALVRMRACAELFAAVRAAGRTIPAHGCQLSDGSLLQWDCLSTSPLMGQYGGDAAVPACLLLAAKRTPIGRRQLEPEDVT